MQIHTRDVKSGGCTDNAKETTQDILRKNHEIGQSPSTPQSIICNEISLKRGKRRYGLTAPLLTVGSTVLYSTVL